MIYGIKELMTEVRYGPEHLLVYGGGGHAKSVIDLVRLAGRFTIAGILDDNPDIGSEVMGVAVLGGSDLLPVLRERGLLYAVNTVGGIGRPAIRVDVFIRLREAGYEFPSLVHPRAFVEANAQLEPGAQVMAMAYVGSESRIGFGSIVNYGAIISHDCILGETVNISPGGTLAGNVTVGQRTQIGMRATVNLGVKVGCDVRIGNGATVKKDVPDGTIIRAGEVWPPRYCES